MVAEDLRRASATAGDALIEARLTLLGLASSPLDGKTLEEALRSEVTWARSTGHLEVGFVTAGTPVALDGELSREVLRTAREALTNIVAHARASTVRLGVLYEPGAVCLLVQDDGQGFDPRSGWQGDRLGLRAMSDRASALGATVDVDSLPGWGTRIRARFPYARADEPESPRLRVLVAARRPRLAGGPGKAADLGRPAIEVTGEAATADEALDACELTRPDVVLVDLGLPAGHEDRGGRRTADGIAGLLIGARPGLAVVGVCDPADERVAAAISAGARGCVDTDADGAELARAVIAASRGQAVLSGPMLTQLHRGLRAGGRAGTHRPRARGARPDGEGPAGQDHRRAARAVGEDGGEARGRRLAQDRCPQPHRARLARQPVAVGEVLIEDGDFHRSGIRGTARTFSLSSRRGHDGWRPRVPVVPLKEILDRAFAERYGVAAINVVNDLTMEAVLAAAVQHRSPVIIQTSVKTVRSVGLDLLFAMWREMTAGIEVPVSLHLDHCPDRAVISACLRKGWNSVLFDASALPVAENQRQTIEVVAEARSFGASVEGEIEAITGVEDGIGSDEVTRPSRCRRRWSSSRRPGSTSSPRRSATRTASTTPSRSSTPSASPTSSPRGRSRSRCTAGRE